MRPSAGGSLREQDKKVIHRAKKGSRGEGVFLVRSEAQFPGQRRAVGQGMLAGQVGIHSVLFPCQPADRWPCAAKLREGISFKSKSPASQTDDGLHSLLQRPTPPSTDAGWRARHGPQQAGWRSAASLPTRHLRRKEASVLIVLMLSAFLPPAIP